MTRRAALALLALGTVTSALAGCTGASDATGTDEAFETVHPGGSDKPGAIVVRLPPGFDETSVSQLAIDNNAVHSGDVIAGLSVGNHSVRVNGVTDRAVLVESNKTTEYLLAAVQVVLPAEPTFGLNASEDGLEPVMSQRGSNLLHLSLGDQSGESIIKPDAGRLHILPHGHVIASWGYGDGIELDAPGGMTTLLPLGSTKDRHLLRIHAPKSRDFPNVATQPNVWVLQYWTGGNQPVTKVSVPTGTTLLIGQAEHPAFGENRMKISLKLPFFPDRDMALSVEPGSPALDQSIGRIDVADVTVTKGDGSTELRPGTFTLKGAANTFQTTSIPTSTGADVWPDGCP